jgi:hypothetical protein
LGAAALAAASLCGCATESDIAKRSEIVPGSAVDKAITAAKADRSPYPVFANFPKKPTDMRPAASWDQANSTLNSDAAALAAVANQPVEIPDPDAYAKAVRARSGLDQIAVPPADEAAQLDAYARELRERATPPPPPQ